MRLAYVFFSAAGHPSSVDEEHEYLLHFLQQKGLDIHKAAWADETVQWEQFNCIILKSPWDYVEKPTLFYAWLDQMTELNIPVLNPADIVEWNCDKHYLKDIADEGLKVIPTAFIEKGSTFNYGEHCKSFDTETLIVKPCVSGSSKNTFLLARDSEEETAMINKLLEKEAMMVQPFIPSVQEEGEWAFLYFGGKFSHALMKKPAEGEFRCQQQFGGSVHAIQPEASVLESATEYVTQFAEGCLYARVDGLVIEGTFYLMELELVDPVLFLSIDEEAAERYYVALQTALHSIFRHRFGSLVL